MKITNNYQMAMAMLDSYKRQSLKIKRDLSPSFYDESKKMISENQMNKPSNQYFKTLSNMTEVYGVEAKYAKSANDERSLFYNATVSFSYIKDYLEKMNKHLHTIENKIVLKLENYEALAKEYNVSIEDDMNLIKSYIDQYKLSDICSTFNQECERKIDILKELSTFISKIEKESFTRSLKKEIPGNTFIGQNYPTDFRKSPELSGLAEILDRAKSEFSNYFVERNDIVDLAPMLELINNTGSIFENIHLKLREAGYQSCIADQYLDAQKDKSVVGFLKNKSNENNEYEKAELYMLPKWSKNKQFIMFKDSSVLIKSDNDEYQNVYSSKELIHLRSRLVDDFINEQFKKNPTIAKNFKEMKNIAYVEHIDTLTKIINKYKENEAILKVNNFELLKTFKDIAANNEHSFTIYEKFDDTMSKIIRDHKIKQYIHSIASKKYGHLYNDETYKIAGELYDLKLPDNSLQDYIGKKLAAFKTPEQFNDALANFVDSFNSFTPEATLKKAEIFGVELISDKDNIIILRIEDYNQSYALGSTSWCISRDESYFKSYADNREQYFLYDFSKRSSHNSSMIGVTLERNGEYNTAHYKDDSDCPEEEEDLIEYLKDVVSEFKNNPKSKNKSINKTSLTV